MVPIHFSNETRALHLAFAGDIDYPALFSIEQMLGCRTEPCLTTQAQLDSALARMEEPKPAEEKLFKNCASEEVVRIVCNYCTRLCATEVRTVTCGEFFWVRVFSPESTDLLFTSQRFLPGAIGFTA